MLCRLLKRNTVSRNVGRPHGLRPRYRSTDGSFARVVEQKDGLPHELDVQRSTQASSPLVGVS